MRPDSSAAFLLLALMAAGCASAPAPAPGCVAGGGALEDVAPIPADSFAVVRLVVAGST